MALAFDITDEAIAKDFVNEIISCHTNLNVFIHLMNRWGYLTVKQREEVIRQCREYHPAAHEFDDDSDELVKYHCNECGFDFEEPRGWKECNDCGSKNIKRL